jgi:hypothetical protein
VVHGREGEGAGAAEGEAKDAGKVVGRERLGLGPRRGSGLEHVQETAEGDAGDGDLAVEEGTFECDSLNPVAGRHDALGQLARVFQKSARQVYARQQSLRQQMKELRVKPSSLDAGSWTGAATRSRS